MHSISYVTLRKRRERRPFNLAFVVCGSARLMLRHLGDLRDDWVLNAWACCQRQPSGISNYSQQLWKGFLKRGIAVKAKARAAAFFPFYLLSLEDGNYLRVGPKTDQGMTPLNLMKLSKTKQSESKKKKPRWGTGSPFRYLKGIEPRRPWPRGKTRPKTLSTPT